MLKKFLIIGTFFLSLFFIDNVKAIDYDDFSSYYQKLDYFRVGTGSNAFNITYKDLQIIEDYFNRKGYYYIISVAKNSNLNPKFEVYLYNESNKPKSMVTGAFSAYYTNTTATERFVFPNTSPILSNSRNNFQINVLDAMQNDTFNGIAENPYDYHLMCGGASTSVEKKFIYSTNIDNLIYSKNASLPLKITEDIYINPGDKMITYKDLNGGPKYIWKDTFNTGTNANDLGTLNLTFKDNENSENSILGKKHFMIRLGPNDFDPNNIPVLENYNFYGKYLNSNTDNYVLINDDYYYISDFTTEIIDNELVIKGTINFLLNACTYSDFIISFNFTNTQNCYAYVFDDLQVSKWTDNPSFLKDYIYYEFPDMVTTAYISGNKSQNFTLYTSYNSVINENIFFKVSQYNLINKTKNNIFSDTYINDTYYVKYDVNLDYENNDIVVIDRVVNTCYELGITFPAPEYYPDFNCSSTEKAFFWVHKDLSVTFTEPLNEAFNYTDDDVISIDSPNGIIFIENQDVKDNVNNNIIWHQKEKEDVLKNIKKLQQDLQKESDYFNLCFNSFFNSLPSVLRTFVIAIYSLLLLKFTMKMGGWH